MTKITFLIHSPAPYHVELLDALAARPALAVSVFYLYPKEHGRGWANPIFNHCAHFLTGANADLQAAQNAANDADLLVVAYSAHPIISKLVALRTANGRAWVFWGENPGARWRGVLARMLRRIRLRWLYASNTPIWAIGSRAVASYRAMLGPQREILNLPYYSNLRRFGGGESESRIPEAPGGVSKGLRFLFVGSLSYRKGVDILLEAFRSMGSGDHTLTLAGAGPLESRLRRSAPPHCVFTGFADWDSLPQTYAGHDCLVVPSRYDGWGMVVPEGLAAGLPVIATDQVGAAIDLVTQGLNGWIATAGSVSSLTTAMNQAASAIPKNREQWRRAALQAVTHHQLEDGVKAMENAIGCITKR